MSKRKLRVLTSGVDNIYFSAHGDLRAGVLEDLERWRDQAKAEGERVRVNLWRTGTPFLVKEHGARGYSYLLASDDMDLMVGAGRNFPPMRVKLRSAFLHSMTEVPAVARVVEILGKDFLVGDPDLQASRIDLYADVQGWPIVEADLGRFVTRAKLRGLYREELILDGRRLTGFRFGRAALMARIYDKTVEIERSGKRWMRDIWGAGLDPEQPVWRLEFQFKRELIKSFQFDGPTQVLWGMQDFWHYATHKWLTYRTPTRTRARRWSIAPIWKEVQGIEIAPQMTGLVRQREKELSEERTARLMQGCLTSLGALNGWSTFGEAWQGALPLVAAEFDEGGRDFAAKVREKAAHRIGVTVIDGYAGEEVAS